MYQKINLAFLTIFVVIISFQTVSQTQVVSTTTLVFPWEKMGLTKRQAITHLLDRFTFGTRKSDIDELEKIGMEAWFQQQLHPIELPQDVVKRVSFYTSLSLSDDKIAAMYPTPGEVLIELKRSGMISTFEGIVDTAFGMKRKEILQYAHQKGYRPQKELIGELIAQKIILARYSPNQIQEVMTDFWFNHFSVSATKRPCLAHIPSYERTVIRANALKNFTKMLIASAKHPAMLAYLDNAQSTAAKGTPTLWSRKRDSLFQLSGLRGIITRNSIKRAEEKIALEKQQAFDGIPEEFKLKRGINENYAREVMELHTIGVGSGYTQTDVTNLARVLTGWTFIPNGKQSNPKIANLLERTTKIGGFVDGNFIFRADTHDANEKTILGTYIHANRGFDEGIEILTVLARHTATARRIAEKIAVRFVSDTPSNALVLRLQDSFLKSDGDIATVLTSLVTSDEFWNPKNRCTKIKKPFEVLISALRAVNADVVPSKKMYQAIEKMGEPLYYAQAPTGFSNSSSAWVNTSSLVYRMNVGLDIASNTLVGSRTPPMSSLSTIHEPESLHQAISVLVAAILPERDNQHLIAQIINNVSSEKFNIVIQNQKRDLKRYELTNNTSIEDEFDDIEPTNEVDNTTTTQRKVADTHSQLKTIVALILGSPEFQRH